MVVTVNSRLKTFPVVLMHQIHRLLGNVVELVDVYIAPQRNSHVKSLFRRSTNRAVAVKTQTSSVHTRTILYSYGDTLFSLDGYQSRREYELFYLHGNNCTTYL